MDFIPERLSLFKLQKAPRPVTPTHAQQGWEPTRHVRDFSGIIIAIRNNSAWICITEVLNRRRQTNQGKRPALCFCWPETVLRELCLPIPPPEPERTVQTSLYRLWRNCSELGMTWCVHGNSCSSFRNNNRHPHNAKTRDIKIYLATAGALLMAAHRCKMSQPLEIIDNYGLIVSLV